MALYKTEKGWGVDYRDEWGKRQRRFVGTHEAAAAVLRTIHETTRVQAQAMRNFQRGSTLQLEPAIDEYLYHQAIAQTSKATIRARLQTLARSLGQSAIAQITPALIHAWLETRQSEIAPFTLFRDVGFIRQFFRWLHQENYIPADPARGFKLKRPTETSARAISYQEEAAALAALQPRLQIRFLLALDAGLALQEVRTLRRHAIDFQAGTLTTFRQKVRRSRTIPLTHRLAQMLAPRCQAAAPDAIICAWGARMVREPNAFLKAARQRGVAHFRFHDLRHTFATRIAAVTPNPFVVSVLLGHALPRCAFTREGKPVPMVTATYVHPSIEELRHAIVAMEAANPNCQENQ